MFVAFLASLSAQTDIPKWRFGIGVGATSLRLHKNHYLDFDLGIIASDVKSSIQREPSHYGFKGDAFASYYLHPRFRLQGALGVAYAHSFATKRVSEKYSIFGFPSNTIIEVNKVDQKYVFLEAPIFIRWHLVLEEKKEAGIRPFLDFGFKLQIPVMNKSTYIQTVNEDRTYGKVGVDSPLSSCFGIGFMIGDAFTLAIDWSFISYENLDYSSTITSLTLSRYF